MLYFINSIDISLADLEVADEKAEKIEEK